EVLPGFSHAIFHEKDRHIAVGKVREFVQECFSCQRRGLTPPKEDGGDKPRRSLSLKDEYDRLCRPGGLRFAPARLFLPTIGRLRRGVALGWERGFDSGSTLDYVYENQAQGTTLLGRLIDRGYLDSIGWRGIRVRRAHLEKLLSETIARTHLDRKPGR